MSGAPRLDMIDVVIHVAITLCIVAMVAGIAHDSGGSEIPPVFGVIAASLVLLAWRRNRARAAGPLSSEDAARLAELEDRLLRLEAVPDRVYELEERVEFAERLLARPDEGGLPARPGDQLRTPAG